MPGTSQGAPHLTRQPGPIRTSARHCLKLKVATGSETPPAVQPAKRSLPKPRGRNAALLFLHPGQFPHKIRECHQAVNNHGILAEATRVVRIVQLSDFAFGTQDGSTPSKQLDGGRMGRCEMRCENTANRRTKHGSNLIVVPAPGTNSWHSAAVPTRFPNTIAHNNVREMRSSLLSRDLCTTDRSGTMITSAFRALSTHRRPSKSAGRST